MKITGRYKAPLTSVFTLLSFRPGIHQRVQIRSDAKNENFKTGVIEVITITKGDL
jgi:hypothetical protein